MKPIYERVLQRRGESFGCEVVQGYSYGTPWHFHPELTLSLQTQGHRIVGDNITPLRPGDLVFMGPNLPHVWHEDNFRGMKRTSLRAIVLQFREDFLGREFLNRPELTPVQQLFQRSARGLQVTGKTRDAVAAKMESIVTARPLQRLIDLLEILQLLAGSRDLKPIATAGFMPAANAVDEQRIGAVCHYINQHLADVIDRSALARLVNLAPNAFSRYFKAHTGKTLPDFINELRIGRVCRRLAEEERSVTEIAMACGFFNLANFNRQFRRLTGQSPRDYRRMLRSAR